MVDVLERTDAPPPEAGILLIDLGRHSRKQIKRLRQGGGKLVDEVQNCLRELRAAGTVPESTVPVVLLVREKEAPLRLF